MTVDRFKWKIQSSPSGSEQVSTNESKFNDGYSQIWSSGINNSSETWELSFTGNSDEVAKLRQFLNNHIIKSFKWVNPWGEDKLYRVQNQSIKSEFITNKLVKLNFTFIQAYSP
ncbi:hypothetical protein A9G11_08370 [Gilliamella sp. wkB108]|uniref:phage tail protein n=1 Tax=Gilliamella sp. wkB108 TaxID=3120256 RepID=UPI00080E7B09|nr:phage tail protein [Gilliamella apicola]OCG21143.1 hypothetical protein A9G11_08370 [Gilliamella apicola]